MSSPLVIQKSRRSGILFGSLGQYVGCRVERCFRLLFFMTKELSTLRIHESGSPKGVFGIVVSSGDEAVSKCLKESVIVFVFIVVLWGQYIAETYFSYVVF